jgi:small subunit ribosomal protein S20
MIFLKRFSKTKVRSPPVANTPQSRKRAVKSGKNRMHNASMRTKTRTYMKRVQVEIEAGNPEGAQTAFRNAQPIMDGMVNKGIYPKNKIARLKHRMSTKIKALSA